MTVELKKRSFDEMITFFSNKVADMDISPSYKMELLGMITAIGFKYEEDTKKRTGRWTNKEWIDFLTEKFDISRTSARNMLHGMMAMKKEDILKRQFDPRG